jgi:quercetin dioxygenase-like cupin family protein
MSGFVRAIGTGPTYEWNGARVTLKAGSVDTLGQLAVMEFSYPAGLSVHSHIHIGEDEMFYVLEGELSGFCDDDEWTAGPGGFVFVPRDRPHGFIVRGSGPARALVVVGPSRLDEQVAASGRRVG